MKAATREDIARMISQAQISGAGHMVALLAPTMRGEMNIIAPGRDTGTPPLWRMSKRGIPVVVLVGDDDYRPAGPSTWACAEKLRSWAHMAMVHGAGAELKHYEAAAALAKQFGRLLLIETTSGAAQSWAAFLSVRQPQLPIIGVLPSDGLHPVEPDRGGLH